MQFGVLGPVTAHHEGHPVDLGPARQRHVLAALLIDANRVVTSDELTDRIWGENPPPRAVPTLRTYLSRLRSTLPATECEINRRSGGYVAQVDDDAVDVHRFRRLAAQARDADDDTAADLLRDALGLWRGSPVTGLDTPWAAHTREALHAERLAAELDFCDVQLRRGEHATVLLELASRAEEHPLDERLARQLPAGKRMLVVLDNAREAHRRTPGVPRRHPARGGHRVRRARVAAGVGGQLVPRPDAHWHDYAEACTTSIAAARRLGSLDVEALMLRGLARAGTRLGAYADAYAHVERARDLYGQLNDANGQAAVHLAFGRLLEPQGHQVEALAHARQSLELYRVAGSPSGQVHALNGIGWCHAQLGDYQETIDSATEALRLAGRIEGLEIAGIWDTLGFAHEHLGQHHQALDCYRQALAEARAQRDITFESQAHTRLGNLHHVMGDVDAAREHWSRALELHRAHDRQRKAAELERKLEALTPTG